VAKLPAQIELELGLDDADDVESLRVRVARRLGLPVDELPPLELCRRGVDARRGKVRFRLLVAIGEGPGKPLQTPLPAAERDLGVVIVGAGPAGLFCAYELARHGVKSLLLERGQAVERRTEDIRRSILSGQIDPESNYCFGEGGAGAFSDGKLYTRSHKRGSVREVLEVLAFHGAPAAILTDARPHLGSDRLPAIVGALRAHLEHAGVGVRFGARVVDLGVRPSDTDLVVEGVCLSDGTQVGARAVVLATGHSAQDVYAWLAHGEPSSRPRVLPWESGSSILRR